MAVSLYTLTALRSLAYDRLEQNTLFWTLPEVDSVINEAIRCLNLFTGFYQGTLRVISVRNQLLYAIPAGMIYPQRVQFEGMQLDPVPITRIGQDYRNWASDTTNKLGAVARWVPIGINYFCLHPIDSVGGQDIEVTGVIETPLLVNGTDTMSLDDEWVALIQDYCASRLPLKEGGAPAAAGAQIYQGVFLKSMKSLTTLRQMVMPRFFVNRGAPVPEGRAA